MQDLRRHLGLCLSYPDEDTILLKLLGALTAALLTVSGLAASAVADSPGPTTVTLVPPTVAQVRLGTQLELGGVVSGGPAAPLVSSCSPATAGSRSPRPPPTTRAPTRFPPPPAGTSAAPSGSPSRRPPTLLAAVSDQVDLNVVPTYVPRGSASDWRRTRAGRALGPVRRHDHLEGEPGRGVRPPDRRARRRPCTRCTRPRAWSSRTPGRPARCRTARTGAAAPAATPR